MKSYVYRLLALLRDKVQIFWIFLFPLLLGTLFYFTFGTLLRSGATTLEISAAAVASEPNQSFEQMLDALTDGENSFLTVTYTDMDEAKRLLKDKKVSGIFDIREQPALLVNENGVAQSVLKVILDRYVQTKDIIKDIAKDDPYAIQTAVEAFTDSSSTIERINLGVKQDDMFRENFYALIAMTCLYAGFFALNCAQSLFADASALGIRRSLAPLPKLKQVITDSLASFTISFCVVLALLAYLGFALKIDLGDSAMAIAAVGFIGALCGNMLGMFVGAAVRGSLEKKIGLLMAISITLSFMSGLMYPQMRFLVAHACPILNMLNPATLIVDALYTLDIYGISARYCFDMGMLTILCAIFTILPAVFLRRKQYANV